MAQRDSRHIVDGGPALVPLKDRALREAENAYLQVVRLDGLVSGAIEAERFDLKPSMLRQLNRPAVDGLTESPSRYRLGRCEIAHSNHEPPEPDDVATRVESLCEYINGNWAMSDLHLAAYTMWMICWIHPFEDGSGRTARAAPYLVLCARFGRALSGEKTIPDQLIADKDPYYKALEARHEMFARGRIQLKELEDLLDRLLVTQIREAASSPLAQRDTRTATGSKSALLAKHEVGMTPVVKAAMIGGVSTVAAASLDARGVRSDRVPSK